MKGQQEQVDNLRFQLLISEEVIGKPATNDEKSNEIEKFCMLRIWFYKYLVTDKRCPREPWFCSVLLHLDILDIAIFYHWQQEQEQKNLVAAVVSLLPAPDRKFEKPWFKHMEAPTWKPLIISIITQTHPFWKLKDRPEFWIYHLCSNLFYDWMCVKKKW